MLLFSDMLSYGNFPDCNVVVVEYVVMYGGWIPQSFFTVESNLVRVDKLLHVVLYCVWCLGVWFL